MLEKYSLNFAKITSLATGVTFILSIIFEIGYFKALDDRFFVFLTITDFLNLTVTWLPHIIMMGAIFTAFDVLSRKRKIKRATLTPSTIKETKKQKPWLVYLIMIAVAIFCFFLFLVDKQGEWQKAILVFMSLWVIYCANLFEGDYILGGDEHKSKRLMVFFVPIVLVGAFFLGVDRGFDIKQNDAVLYETPIKGEATNIFVVRAIQRGLIYKEQNRSLIHFAPWGEIKSTTSLIYGVKDETRMCSYFPMFCSE